MTHKVILVTLGVVGAILFMKVVPTLHLPTTGDAQKGPSSFLLATVNGNPVYDTDLAAMIQDGTARAVALDRRISQMVLSNAAETEFSVESNRAVAAARSDILAQLYISKRTALIRNSITEAEIKTFYDQNITSDASRELKLKALLSENAKDAQTTYEALTKGLDTPEGKAAAAHLEYLNKVGDHFLPVLSVPYNLGHTMRSMKAGDVLPPTVIREGVLVVLLEDSKDPPRPSLEKVHEQIRNFLVNDRIQSELKSLRQKAVIELKG